LQKAETNDVHTYILNSSAIWQTNLFIEHNAPVFRAEFSPDGRYVLTSSADSKPGVWDAANARPVSNIAKESPGTICIKFNSAGDNIATATPDPEGSGQTVPIWSTSSWEPVTPWLPHKYWVLAAMFSPDDTRLATAAGWLDTLYILIWRQRVDIALPSQSTLFSSPMLNAWSLIRAIGLPKTARLAADFVKDYNHL
jgi:WD40 repeat protein